MGQRGRHRLPVRLDRPSRCLDLGPRRRAGPGHSLAFVSGAWVQGKPAPWLAPGEAGGGIKVDVANVPPATSFGALPGQVEPAAEVQIQFFVEADGGAQDVTERHLYGNDDLLLSGVAGGGFSHAAAAPKSGAWVLRILAIDQGGAGHESEATVTIATYGFTVTMPVGGLQFPQLAAGAINVTSNASFLLRTDGPSAAVPKFDFSNLKGIDTIVPAGA